MVVIAVIAIVAGVAVPAFREMLLRSRLTASANEINAALQMAKLEAVRTNSRVELCPSANGATCSGGDWRRFIMVSSKAPGEVVREVSLSRGSMTALGSAAITDNGNKMVFFPDGFVRVGGVMQASTIGVCASGLSGDNARDIQVSMSRVSVSRGQRAGCAAPGN